jgi:hypothetical protein
MQITAGRACQVGQPVAVGRRDGRPVSALRLCVSMRNVQEAVSNRSGEDDVIAGALAVLDKAAWLAQQTC